MNRLQTAFLVLVVVFAVAASAPAEEPAMGGFVSVAPGEVVWGGAPPTLPPGAKRAAVAGDPSVEGMAYTFRLWLPAGYTVAPHWHPVPENVTVLSGSILIGMGDTVDRAATKKLGVGGFFSMPAEHHHFAIFDEETILQIHGTGPFRINYVNPADDPRNATPAE